MATFQIHYFGEIAEKTGKSSESIEMISPDTNQLLEYLKKQYNIEGNGIQIAVNHALVNTPTKLNETDEVAILSPFAGG